MPKTVGVAITPRTASRLSQTINKKELTPTNSKRPPFVPPVYNDLTVFVNKTGATLQRGYIVYADGRDNLGRQQAKKFDAAAITKSHCQWVVVTEKGRTIPADGEFLASRFSQRPGIIAKSGTAATGSTIGAQAGSFVGMVGNPGFSITSATGFDMTSSEVEAGFFSGASNMKTLLFNGITGSTVLLNQSSVTGAYATLTNTFNVDDDSDYVLLFAGGCGSIGTAYPTVDHSVWVDIANDDDEVILTATIATAYGISSGGDQLVTAGDVESLGLLYPTARIAEQVETLPSNKIATQYRLRVEAENPSENRVYLQYSSCYLIVSQ